MRLTVPVLRVLPACRGERTDGPLVLMPLWGEPIDRRDKLTGLLKTAWKSYQPEGFSRGFQLSHSSPGRQRYLCG